MKQMAVGKKRISNLQRTAAGAQEVPEEAVLGVDREEGGREETKGKDEGREERNQEREKLKEGREEGKVGSQL